VDTAKILQKFGPGCLFYGHGTAEDLDELERKMQSGEKYLGFFCEFPGNPLLNSPDMKRIQKLANEYDLVVIVDETVGTFVNVDVLSYADIICTSLSKIFSGACNVMGGR
jgi:cystathionine gamma-synthase